MSNINDKAAECCPQFIPQPWQDLVIEWHNKKFIKDKICTLLYMPVNFGKVITRMLTAVDKAEAICKDYLCLSEHTSMWNMNMFVAVDRDIPGFTQEVLNGKFYSRVYEGSFNKTGQWTKDFAKAATEKGLKTGRLFMWYTTCPKCAKKFGKNYVVLLAEVV